MTNSRNPLKDLSDLTEMRIVKNWKMIPEQPRLNCAFAGTVSAVYARRENSKSSRSDSHFISHFSF